MGPLILISPNI